MTDVLTKAKHSPRTADQLDYIYPKVDAIINMFDDRSLNEIGGGSEADVDNLLNIIENEAFQIFDTVPEPITEDKFYNLTNVTQSIHESLKVLNYNYFKVTMMPEFYLGAHSIAWGNIVQLYERTCILASRGLGKCFAPGTKVVMFNGLVKKVEDINIGDQVMGIDSKPRNVLSIHNGVDNMYKIKQNRSSEYIVNSQHLLHYKHRTKQNTIRIEEIEAEKFYKKVKNYKNRSYGYRIKGWELKEKKQTIDPYFLGVWIGDGRSKDQEIVNPDIEIINYLKKYANELGMSYMSYDNNMRHRISSGGKGIRNKVMGWFRELDLLKNKHIPDNYLYGSRKQRLELLAGLIDSDGTKNQTRGIVISQINEDIIKQIQKLCWSLGFKANYNSIVAKSNYSNGKYFTTYIIYISGDTWDIPIKIQRKKVDYIDSRYDMQRASLDIELLDKGEYYGFSCDGDHLFLLEDGTVAHNSYEFSLALPIWKMYGYRKSTDLNPIDLNIQRRKEGLIITNKFDLGRKLLSKIATEIKENNALWERLKPTHKDEGVLGRERIETKNGCEINLRSAESTARGLHPDWIVVDDFGNNNWIYSKEQRDKGIAHFYGDIMKTIERGGTINIAATPLHETDLYAYIRENDHTFKYFEYPAIMPDGTIIAPHRWNLEELDEEYRTNGSLIFSREILCVPISDSSTIFPWSILENAFINMQSYRLVENRDSFPLKFKYVSIGCDFAISGNIGADSTVFTVWGIDDRDNFWLLHVWRKQGAKHNEQIAKLGELERNFRPDEIVAENNGFQQVMLDLAKERNIKNITEFTTTGWNKKDAYEGLPSLAILFEQGRMRFPRGDAYSKEITDWLCSEFNSITVKPDTGKLESSGEHDDGPMSSFFGIKGLSANKNKKFNFIMIN